VHRKPASDNCECAGIYAARKLDADALFLCDFPMMEGIQDFCDRYPNPELENLKTLPLWN
jgi:hypothetical protein